jgi:hypothetical protein
MSSRGWAGWEADQSLLHRFTFTFSVNRARVNCSSVVKSRAILPAMDDGFALHCGGPEIIKLWPDIDL